MSVVVERSSPPKQVRPASSASSPCHSSAVAGSLGFCLSIGRALQRSQASIGSQRVACSVHWFRCRRRNTFSSRGELRASSQAAAIASSLGEMPRFGLALAQTFGSVQSSSGPAA